MGSSGLPGFNRREATEGCDHAKQSSQHGKTGLAVTLVINVATHGQIDYGLEAAGYDCPRKQ